MVGRGRIDIACATDVARAVLGDGVSNEQLTKLASLGCFGSSQPNAERDLHRWMGGNFGLYLEPYTIDVKLKEGVSLGIDFLVF